MPVSYVTQTVWVFNDPTRFEMIVEIAVWFILHIMMIMHTHTHTHTHQSEIVKKD